MVRFPLHEVTVCPDLRTIGLMNPNSVLALACIGPIVLAND